MKHVTEAMMNEIEDRCVARITQLYGYKLGGKRSQNVECNFFAGAMCAMQAMFPNPDPNKISEEIPPKWFAPMICGRSIIEESGRFPIKP